MTDLRMPDWGPDLSVGHPQLDAQHRGLITLGQQVIDLLDAPDTEAGQFHRLLNDVADAMRRHFLAEEAVLQANRCPKLMEHRALHDQYLERLTELLYGGTNGIADKAGLARLIHELIDAHVRQQDMPLRAYLQQGGKG